MAVSVSDDRTLRLWDLENGREVWSVATHAAPINSVVLTDDDKRAVSGSDDHTIRLWNLGTAQVIASFTADAPIRTCAISGSLGIIIAGDDLGRTHLLRIEMVEEVPTGIASAALPKDQAARPLLPVSSPKGFDVFLCHNIADKPAVRRICAELKRRGIKPWLDEEQIAPGTTWLDGLEQGIREIACAAVFVGRDGFGPWQLTEVRAILRKFVRRSCRVIPIILEECLTPPELPTFLDDFQWVDFRVSYPEPWTQLIWGITGQREYFANPGSPRASDGEGR
jgi:hypothetical protein